MQLAALLNQGAVRSLGRVTSKKRLFQELADMAQTAYGLPAAPVMMALQAREALGSTGVGHGVALPHARLEGIGHVIGLFLRLDHPMNFEAVDRCPVDLIFALLAPVNSGVEHLKALALVSRTLQNKNLREKLRANHNTKTILEIIKQEQPFVAQ